MVRGNVTGCSAQTRR